MAAANSSRRAAQTLKLVPAFLCRHPLSTLSTTSMEQLLQSGDSWARQDDLAASIAAALGLRPEAAAAALRPDARLVLESVALSDLCSTGALGPIAEHDTDQSGDTLCSMALSEPQPGPGVGVLEPLRAVPGCLRPALGSMAVCEQKPAAVVGALEPLRAAIRSVACSGPQHEAGTATTEPPRAVYGSLQPAVCSGAVPDLQPGASAGAAQPLCAVMATPATAVPAKVPASAAGMGVGSMQASAVLEALANHNLERLQALAKAAARRHQAGQPLLFGSPVQAPSVTHSLLPPPAQDHSAVKGGTAVSSAVTAAAAAAAQFRQAMAAARGHEQMAMPALGAQGSDSAAAGGMQAAAAAAAFHVHQDMAAGRGSQPRAVPWQESAPAAAAARQVPTRTVLSPAPCEQAPEPHEVLRLRGGASTELEKELRGQDVTGVTSAATLSAAPVGGQSEGCQRGTAPQAPSAAEPPQSRPSPGSSTASGLAGQAEPAEQPGLLPTIKISSRAAEGTAAQVGPAEQAGTPLTTRSSSGTAEALMLAASGPQAVLLQNPDGSTQYVLLTSDQQQAVQLALQKQSAIDQVRSSNLCCVAGPSRVREHRVQRVSTG